MNRLQENAHVIVTRKPHWSWDDKLAEASGRRMLARRIRARKQVNTILGACLAGVMMEKEPLQLLAEAERAGVWGKGRKMLCEL